MRWLAAALYLVTFLVIWLFVWYAAADPPPTGADQFVEAELSTGEAQLAACGFRVLLRPVFARANRSDLAVPTASRAHEPGLTRGH
jgi:hypothetical protein